MHTDPIADLITRIRNADRAGNTVTAAPYSKIKEEILKILAQNKFIDKYRIEKGGQFPELIVTLAKSDNPLTLKRVSKPGQRIYVKAPNIRPVLNGLGIAIISTSKGMLTNKDAYHQKLGGEIICEIY